MPPAKNPFYVALLGACALLLVTMFTYLTGALYAPDPDRKTPILVKPPMIAFVDKYALTLIASEIAAIVVLTILTITLDQFFDPPTRLEAKGEEADSLPDASVEP